MKKLYFILVFQISILVAGYAQVIPKGMNYQAVARNLKGELISNESIRLKIYLFGNEKGGRTDHYIEIHEVTTNELGLFNVIVGEGKKEEGEYGLIPWNQENIWMEVAVQDKERTGFATVSSSKLMAVPYAIHAITADRLVDQNTSPVATFAPPEPGVISTEWSVFGNAKTDASGNIFRLNSLGTTDVVDLIMITNNKERMRIFSTGDILTKLNFEIGKTLNVGDHLFVNENAMVGDSLIVKKNVVLNNVSGSTINYGEFTVANLSPTLLTGTLTVDKITDFNTTLNVERSTHLNGRLYVNKHAPSKFSGTLVVDSITNINDALNVNNISPTYLTGTLEVDSGAVFQDRVKILSAYSTDTSGATVSGSLQIGGGAYIRENLYVGGIAKFGGPVGFGAAVAITDGTQSTSKGTGALKVSGGVGIGLNLNVGGAATIGGMLTIKDLTQSIDSTTGALKIFGGMGIRRNLQVAGAVSIANAFTVNGVTTLTNVLNVTNASNYIAEFINSTDQNGISIQVANPNPGWSNNFVEFRNSGGGVVGRIEGENGSQYTSNPDYVRRLTLINTWVDAAELIVIEAALNVAMASADVAAAASSSTACLGLGACVTFPIPSLIIVAVAKLALRIIAVSLAGVGLDRAFDNKDAFIAYKAARYGVTYESGSGDYAEWLQKSDTAEHFIAGDIVSMNSGKITKKITHNSKLLVISTMPIVLGNMPDPEQIRNYEKVAFLGQVPVLVNGIVNPGDYILPSGKEDGWGIACIPANMRVEDYSRIVGVAWSGSMNDTLSYINVAIGLYTGDINKVIVDQEKMIDKLETEFNETNKVLVKMVPGFKEAADFTEAETSTQSISSSASKSPKPSFAGTPNPISVIEIRKTQMMETMGVVEKTFIENGGSLEAVEIWKHIKSDPGYIDQFIKDLGIEENKEIRAQLQKIRPRQ